MRDLVPNGTAFLEALTPLLYFLLLHTPGSQGLPAGIVAADGVPGRRVHRLVANKAFVEKEM